MPRFAANLTLMFTEHPFLDRFMAAADAGFEAVEFLFPYDHEPDAVARRLAQAKVELALFNMPPGDWAAGDRGLAALPDRAAAFREGVDVALRYARETGAKKIHAMAGVAGAAVATAGEAYRAALAFVCDRSAEHGVDVLIEPLNARDMPGYFLNDFQMAAAIIDELRRPNLKLQFDVYHRQILHGDVVRGLEALFPVIGHVQIASAPGRNEPGTGELDERFVFDALDRLGYDGFVGCEYRPLARTEEGLAWLKPYRSARPS